MRIVKNTFIDIHYFPNERKMAEKKVRQYEKQGYGIEADCDDNVIQLLRTKSDSGTSPLLVTEVKNEKN